MPPMMSAGIAARHHRQIVELPSLLRFVQEASHDPCRVCRCSDWREGLRRLGLPVGPWLREAKRARVFHLIPFHFSARYRDRADELTGEAEEAFRMAELLPD